MQLLQLAPPTVLPATMMNIDNTIPLSLLDSDDSDDAVNSSSAKVYFGPILSPEKKLVSKFNQSRGAQDRRTPESLAIPSHLAQDSFSQISTSSIQDILFSPPITPKFSNKDIHGSYSLVEDEPSSLLATRVIRALDNPSPPPKSRHYAARTLDDSRSSQEEMLVEISLLDLPAPDESSVSSSSEDLISFDQPLAGPRNDSVKSFAYSHKQSGSFGDFLSESPVASSQQINTLPLIVTMSQEDALSTPRRNSRLSPSPNISQGSQSMARRKRKRGDGMTVSPSRAQSSMGPVMEREIRDSDRTQSKSRGISKREKKRLKLDDSSQEIILAHSLSPSSADVLTSLMTPNQTMKDRTISSFKKIEPSPLPSLQPFIQRPNSDHQASRSSPQRPPPGTPYIDYDSSVYVTGVDVLISPRRLNSDLDDPTRTPARRVPMHQPTIAVKLSKMKSLPFNPSKAAFKSKTVSRPITESSGLSPSAEASKLKLQVPRNNLFSAPKDRIDGLQAQTGANKSKSSPLKLQSTYTSISVTPLASRVQDVPVGVLQKNISDSKIPRGTFTFKGPTLVGQSGERTSVLHQSSMNKTRLASNQYTETSSKVNNGNVKSRSLKRVATNGVPQRIRSPQSSPSRRSPIGGRKIPGAFPSLKASPMKSKILSAVHFGASPSKEIAESNKPRVPRAVIKGTLQDFEIRTACFGELQRMSDARARERELKAEEGRSNVENKDLNIPQMVQVLNEATHVKHSASPPSSDIYAESNIQLNEIISSPPSSPPIPTLKFKTPRTPVINGTMKHSSTGKTSSGRRRGQRTLNHTLYDNSGLPTNALALKTLTNSNTAKNQEYYSELQTEVVRKSGNRPLSPVGKARPIMQKQKEDQDKRRAERAKRRRGEDVCGSDADISAENGDFVSLKHPRAPGDEEDYVTPERYTVGKKRVKWDKALSVSKTLEEIEPRSLGQHREMINLTKGCLIKSMVSVDSFGNVTSTGTPLDLVREQITVTKVVYDDDEGAQDQASATTTRTKKVQMI